MMAAWGPDDLSGTDASEGKGPMSGQPVGDLKYTEDRESSSRNDASDDYSGSGLCQYLIYLSWICFDVSETWD